MFDFIISAFLRAFTHIFAAKLRKFFYIHKSFFKFVFFSSEKLLVHFYLRTFVPINGISVCINYGR